MFKPEPNSNEELTKSSKRKVPARVIATTTKDIMDTYMTSNVRRRVSNDDDDDGNNRAERMSVNIESLRQQQLAHRGSHQDTAFLDREVEAYLEDTS